MGEGGGLCVAFFGGREFKKIRPVCPNLRLRLMAGDKVTGRHFCHGWGDTGAYFAGQVTAGMKLASGGGLYGTWKIAAEKDALPFFLLRLRGGNGRKEGDGVGMAGISKKGVGVC